jgi:hypothetical protein
MRHSNNSSSSAWLLKPPLLLRIAAVFGDVHTVNAAAAAVVLHMDEGR